MPNHRFKPRGYRVRPTSRRNIREIAELTRKILGANDPFVDVERLVEHRLGAAGIQWHIASAEELPSGVEALAVPDRQELLIRSDVYEALPDRTPAGARARFTVVHEFGHLVLHRGVPFARTQEHPNERSHQAYEDSEWQADRFAAEFLMPEGLLVRLCSSVEDVMEVFGVSQRAARIRVDELRRRGLIKWGKK